MRSRDLPSMTVRTPVELGATIRDRRRRLHLGQRDLAAKVGVSRQWIIAVEKGKPRVETGLVFRTLAALGITFRATEEGSPSKKAAPAVEIDAVIARARRTRGKAFKRRRSECECVHRNR